MGGRGHDEEEGRDRGVREKVRDEGSRLESYHERVANNDYHPFSNLI